MKDVKGVGELDLVAGWYKKSAEYIQNTQIKVAFVSTNSICQGQQATTLWKELFKDGIHINFAYRTFVWDSEATQKAKVHCIIVGFSTIPCLNKRIYDKDNVIEAKNINSYLMDSPTIFIESRSIPISNVPKLIFGSMPRDGGFILSEEEKEQIIRKEPLSTKWIKLYLGASEFLHNKMKYCLWLKNADPSEIKQCKIVCNRIEFVRDFRRNSKAAGTRKYAEIPQLFCQIAQPEVDII